MTVGVVSLRISLFCDFVAPDNKRKEPNWPRIREQTETENAIVWGKYPRDIPCTAATSAPKRESA